MRTADPAKLRRISEAAVQLFAERPYHEVRMEDIAARAQVAKGTLYLHYEDKEALFLGIMNEALCTLIDRVEANLEQTMPPAEKLLMMNRTMLRFFEQNHFFLDVIQRVQFLRFGGRAECYEEARTRLHAILIRILREFPSRALASDEDLALDVIAHGGMMKELLHSLPRPWPADLAERVTARFLHGAIPSASAAPRAARQPAKKAAGGRRRSLG